MALTFPPILRATSSSWKLENPSRSGGVGISGLEQVVMSNAARWSATLAFTISARQRESVALALRGFLAQAMGRANEILLPVFDGYRPYNDDWQMANDKPGAAFGDGAVFWDHSEWGQDDVAMAKLAAAASAGDTDITLTLQDGAGPRPGQYFSIAGRLYIARFVWIDDSGSPPDTSTHVRFAPRLRADAAHNANVILDKPVCTMRLADDDQGELVFDMRRFGSISLNFVEAL